MLYTHMHTYTYTHVQFILTQWIIKTSEDFFKKIYISLYCKGLKRVTQGFTVRGSWRPNRTAIYWPPLWWPSALCLFRSPDAEPEARGPTLLAFSTASYHQLVGSPNSIGGPEGPFCWVVAFPTTSCLQLVWCPTHWLPVLTELYNSSIAH